MKHIDSVGTDLVPDDQVVLDAPTEDLPMDAAIQSARNGDWTLAARLLDQTRGGPDWDLREVYIGRLTGTALEDSRWLSEWRERTPDDPNALLLQGSLFVHRAWEQRGARRAKYTTEDQFEGFFHYLELAGPALRAAAEANPADPTPWSLMITWAMGNQEPRNVFDEAWSQAVARSPYNAGAHDRALQYLCDKWHGSHKEMFDFANAAAGAAPPGSVLHTLPLDAWIEYGLAEDFSVLEQPGAIDAVNRALTVLPPDGPATFRWNRTGRNVLAYALWMQDRHEEALNQFRAIGPYATSHPWHYIAADDERQEFLEIREGVRIEVAIERGRPRQ